MNVQLPLGRVRNTNCIWNDSMNDTKLVSGGCSKTVVMFRPMAGPVTILGL